MCKDKAPNLVLIEKIQYRIRPNRVEAMRVDIFIEDVRRGESVSDIETKLVMATQAKWFDILVVELHAIPV